MARDVPAERLHTKVAVRTQEQADQLLDGAWERLNYYANNLGIPTETLHEALHSYTSELMKEAMSHDLNLLRKVLSMRGVV